MKYELVFQIFQILVFQILAYLSIYHVSGMVSVEKDLYRYPKKIPIYRSPITSINHIHMENHSLKFGPNPKSLTFFASAISQFAFFR